MSDIAVVDLKRKAKKATSLRRKTMSTPEGKSVRVVSIDANSKTFLDDLTKAFEINVRKARQENKRLFGSADGVRKSTTRK
ncbi:MAG TPA: hypothetical protein VIJ67_12760 [Pseudolabrys sp.]|jgi:hypothetical protein